LILPVYQMKIFFTLLTLAFFTVQGRSQQAVDFTVNDCSGTSHHLFAELNSGKVVVIAFVMPCASCIGPSKSANTTVNDYATSNPGRVAFYIADDLANTSCSTVSGWANANGMSGIPVFSDASVKMTDYGAEAMPKIVVLGGWGHKVFFTQDNGLNVTNLKNAINAALIGTGIGQKQDDLQFNIYPNPVVNSATISCTIPQSGDADFSVFSLTGHKIQTFKLSGLVKGKNTIPVDLGSLANGSYLVRLESDSYSESIKLIIIH
jgi:hypothetical protein